MGHMRLLVSERHWPHKPLHLDRFPCEPLTNKRGFRHHSLPRLALVFPVFKTLNISSSAIPSLSVTAQRTSQPCLSAFA